MIACNTSGRSVIIPLTPICISSRIVFGSFTVQTSTLRLSRLLTFTKDFVITLVPFNSAGSCTEYPGELYKCARPSHAKTTNVRASVSPKDVGISGHRMGTAEVESALVLHEKIAEAAVVGYPHDIKGQGIYCYVTPMTGVEPDEQLRAELIALCAKEIGPIAKPDIIQWAPGLPKTRSGKIMRRILRKVAANELDNLGDTSTLADPSVVQQLIDNRLNH